MTDASAVNRAPQAASRVVSSPDDDVTVLFTMDKSDDVDIQAELGMPRRRSILGSLLARLADPVKAYLLRQLLEDNALVRKYLKIGIERMFAANSTICNVKCVFCPQPFHKDERRFMELETFKQAVRQFVAAGGHRITICPNNGDPLTDPTYVDKLRFAREAGVKRLDSSTNGILLKRGNLAEELAQVIDSLSISMPGLDREDYKRVYGVDKADDLLEGLIKLADAKRASGRDFMIRLDLRLDRPVAEVLNDAGMRSLAPYLKDGTISMFPVFVRSEDMENWQDIEGKELPGIMKWRTDKPRLTRPCVRIKQDIAILADGKVRFCAVRYSGTNYDELVGGDINQQDLSEIVGGPAHIDILRKAAAGQHPKVCQNCALYQGIDFPRATYLSIAGDLVKGWLRRS